MSSKKILAIILKTPLILLVFASFIASIYAANKKLYINYATSLTLGIIL